MRKGKQVSSSILLDPNDLFQLLIINEEEKRVHFFKLSFLAGIIIIIIFLPALKIFIKITEIKDFWIPAPTADAYTLIFKEFFGNSEMVLTLLGVFGLLYFFKLENLQFLD